MSESFFQMLENEYRIQLNEQQRSVVMHTSGPCLILAVPGGGKTTTLLSRSAYLIGYQKVDPQNILSITFSRASANDMKSRFTTIFKSMIKQEVSFSTIHSFAYRVVMGYQKSHHKVFKLIEGNEEDQWAKVRLLRRIYQEINNDYLSDGDLEELIGDISYVKNMMFTDLEIKKYPSDIQEFYRVYSQYETIKKEHHYIDFDDMLILCHKIFQELPQVLEFYQNKYRYIQVDEAQDTSRLQHEIIFLLGRKHQNVFYVADDDQSIYGFRGASPKYLLNLTDYYPGVKIYRMEQNYRSTKEIVKNCHLFIQKNKKRYPKDIYTMNKEGDPIEILQVENRFGQVEEIIKRLNKETDYSSIAILYRNNNTAVSLVKSLYDQHIPFYLKDYKRKFFSHWIIADLLNLMEFAKDISRLDLFGNFYYKLKGFYISKQMVEGIKGSEGNGSVFDLILTCNSLEKYKVDNIIKLQGCFRRLAQMVPLQGIEYILETLGYYEFLCDRGKSSDATFDNYMAMVMILKNVAGKAKTLQELHQNIEELESILEAGSKNRHKNAMTLSTIHSSKGLEWDKVYMVDLVEGVFPNREIIQESNKGNTEELEEERRLFYVGMTRAKSYLGILRVKESKDSIFLEEVSHILEPRVSSQSSIKESKLLQDVNNLTHHVNYKGVNISRTTSLSYQPLTIGAGIFHKRHGEGNVVSCDRETLVVEFQGLIKKFSFQYCMEEGIITCLVDIRLDL